MIYQQLKKLYPRLVLVAWCVVMLVPGVAGGNESVLARVESYLNNLETFAAEFEQRSSDGGVAEGMFYLDRVADSPRLKLDYGPPASIMILTRGDTLIYFDKELEQTSYTDVDATPAAFLLQENMELEQAGRVSDVLETEQDIYVTLKPPEDAEELQTGHLTLKFKKNPLRLVSWTVKDVQGIVTDVYFTDIKENREISESIFEFRDPRFFGHRR